MQVKRSTSFIYAIVTLSAGSGVAAQPSKMSVCDGYAQHAIARQADNARLGCGLKGTQWNSRID